ncbi:MAG: Crp/Fnr family transcriptional regulator [Polyangiales bacterium]
MNPLFRDASEPVLDLIASEAVVRRFEDGQSLWTTGEPSSHFMLIQRGLVQIVRQMVNGTIATLSIFGPRECVGTVAVLSRRPYPAEAIAHGESVEIIAVRAEPVLRAMHSDPALTLAFNQVLCEQTLILRSRIDVLSAGSVPQRLATLLLHLGERFGDTTHTGTTHIPISLSRSSLARLVSARVETVIRTASDWQKRSLITTDDDGFELLDAAALQSIADGA